MSKDNKCKVFNNQRCLCQQFCNDFECARKEALNESFNKSPIGSAFIDKSGKFITINNSFSNIIGYSADEIEEKNYIEIIFEKDLNEYKKKSDSMSRGEIDQYNIEKRYIKKDGSIVWVDLHASGVFGANKEFLYFIIHAIDIDSFKQQKNLVNFAAEAGKIGIWIWKEATNELVWNKEMFEIYEEKQRDNLTYIDWAKHLHPEDKERAEKEVLFSMKNGRIFDTNFKIVVNGKIKIIKARAQKIGVEPNRILTGCNIDISDSTSLQKEVQKHHEELEYFTYSASHDLKSPLVTLSGFSSLINNELNKSRDKIDLDLVREFSHEIKKASQNLASTVDSILHLSRIGRIYLEKTFIDTKTIVEQISNVNSIRIKQEDVIINNNDNLNIFVQKEIFISIIQNLVTNSLDHAKVKDKQLVIDINFYTDKENSFIIDYKDNGKGMNKKQIDNLFNYSNREFAKGFGMMIIKKGIESHHGTMEIKSEINKGTQFLIKMDQND